MTRDANGGAWLPMAVRRGGTACFACASDTLVITVQPVAAAVGAYAPSESGDSQLTCAKDENEASPAGRGRPPPGLLPFVHLISLAERRPRACSVENSEVGLEYDQRELHHRIAWLSERLAAGTALTAQIRPTRERGRRPR
jgi:hypothetical protein